jgi:hypothetical protein
MSQLPAAGNAVIDDRKITEYLLCRTHPQGAGKANFLRLSVFLGTIGKNSRKHCSITPSRIPSPITRSVFMEKNMSSVARWQLRMDAIHA